MKRAKSTPGFNVSWRLRPESVSAPLTRCAPSWWNRNCRFAVAADADLLQQGDSAIGAIGGRAIRSVEHEVLDFIANRPEPPQLGLRRTRE